MAAGRVPARRFRADGGGQRSRLGPVAWGHAARCAAQSSPKGFRGWPTSAMAWCASATRR